MSSFLLQAIEVPTLSWNDWFDTIIDWISATFQPAFNVIADVINFLVEDGMAAAFHAVPPLIMAILLALIAYLGRSLAFGGFALVAMLYIQTTGLWDHAMDTLALVVVASVIAMALALPLGILAAKSTVVSNMARPILDVMQTLPVFVWLIPAVVFFSIGVPAGMVATIIFAMPPGVRLTELGIRQVDPEMVEAGYAFGSPPRSILTRIQLPLALPTIMAGVNQVIMLALSMVVVAGMVGAGGLGADIYGAITQLKIGLGFSSGFGVVILAIYLDRVTAGIPDRYAEFSQKLSEARRSKAAPISTNKDNDNVEEPESLVAA